MRKKIEFSQLNLSITGGKQNLTKKKIREFNKKLLSEKKKWWVYLFILDFGLK